MSSQLKILARVAAHAGYYVLQKESDTTHFAEGVIAWTIVEYVDRHGDTAGGAFPVTLGMGAYLDHEPILHPDGRVTFGSVWCLDEWASTEDWLANSDARGRRA